MTGTGEVDLGAVGALLGDPGRCRMLGALADGRALPASVLAAEAGVSRSTASGHLRQLLDGGLVGVEIHGRHRYYRLAGADVADLVETLARLAPLVPARSLGDDLRATALRRGRTCYDHLAGRLGVDLLDGLVARGLVGGHDGSFRRGLDRLSAGGRDLIYHLTAAGAVALADLGVDATRAPLTARAGIRHCVDWSEQRHHLAGRVGAALADRLFELGWIERGPVRRTVVLTDGGRTGLDAHFGITDLSRA